MSQVVGNHRLGSAHIIQGNALNLPLPDASVDLICTSPPYFGLRSYQDAGAHYEGQLGSEATPAEFLDALLAATREMVRVLKPSGSLFVNLGDKYSSAPSGYVRHPGGMTYTGGGRRPYGVQPKSLLGIPWRYAINCIDQLGLILRAEIIWSKPNGLPESVTDRVRRSHEQWFHFVKQPRYFSAVDEIREPTDPTVDRHVTKYTGRDYGKTNGHRGDLGASNFVGNSLGKLPGSVWTVPTQPLSVPPELGVDHFAAYPMEFPRRIITGWTPNGICTGCGEGRRPTVERDRQNTRPLLDTHALHGAHGEDGRNFTRGITDATITGYTCGCLIDVPVGGHRPLSGTGSNGAQRPPYPPPTRPAVVLDPFGGTGTTALVAKALGRIGITIDLSSDYCRLAEWRCNDPRELAAALQVEKPESVPDGQLSLFG